MGNISCLFMMMTSIYYEIIYKPLGKNTEICIKACKDIGLEVNTKKTKYMITSTQQNVVQNQNITIGNLSIKNVQV